LAKSKLLKSALILRGPESGEIVKPRRFDAATNRCNSVRGSSNGTPA
jgi:hypothetical protein